jgi:hypothetical protein
MPTPGDLATTSTASRLTANWRLRQDTGSRALFERPGRRSVWSYGRDCGGHSGGVGGPWAQHVQRCDEENKHRRRLGPLCREGLTRIRKILVGVWSLVLFVHVYSFAVIRQLCSGSRHS